MGFCPMAWASPMLARMTSVKGFFTPWVGGADGENRPHDSRRPLSHATWGMGPTGRPGRSGRAGAGARAYLAQLLLQLQGAHHNGAANGVLHPPNARVHGVQRQHLFLYPCHCSLAVVTCSQGHDPAQTRQEGGSGGGTVRKWGEGSWVQAQWPGWGGGLKIRGRPLHHSLLAPLKGTERAGGGAGDTGPAPLIWAQLCPREPQGVGEEAGGAWGEARCLPSISMTGAGDPHGG